MQNNDNIKPLEDQPKADNSVQQAAANQATQVGNEVKSQVSNLGQEGAKQVANLGQEGAKQVENLGKAGAEQVQNLGKESVKQVSGMMSAFTQPLSAEFKQQQPPVTKDEKVYATLAYVPLVAFLSIIVKPDSAYVRLHARQGILISILFFFAGLFAAIVSLFGVIGTLLAFLIGLIPLACMIIAVYSMYLALTGIWWKIPVLSAVAEVIPVEWLAKTSKENITGQAGIAKVDYDNRSDVIKAEKTEAVPNVPTTQTTDTNQQNQVPEKK